MKDFTPPPMNEEIVQYVIDQGMPSNIVDFYTAFGTFSDSPSPLTPESTLEEVQAFVTASEVPAHSLFSSPDVVAYADEMLKNVKEEIITIQGVDCNDIPIYVTTPKRCKKPTRAILHIHGGGMAILSAGEATFRAGCRLLAMEGLLVAGVDFRNSSGSGTRSPFPGGLNDCVSALQWLVNIKHIEEVTVVGESGGANLCISTCVRAASQGVTRGKLKGAVPREPFIAGPSVWGAPESSGLPSLIENNGAGAFTETWFQYGRLYTPNEKDWKIGEAWPFFLSDEEIDLLPEMALYTADLDALRDEGLKFSKRLAAAGKLVTHGNCIGFTHATSTFPFNSDLIRIMELSAKSVSAFALRNKCSDQQ